MWLKYAADYGKKQLSSGWLYLVNNVHTKNEIGKIRCLYNYIPPYMSLLDVNVTNIAVLEITAYDDWDPIPPLWLTIYYSPSTRRNKVLRQGEG